jgi:hypothetical protein
MTPADQQRVRETLANPPEGATAESLDAEIDAEIDPILEDIEREAPIKFPEERPKNRNIGYWAMDEDDEFAQIFDDDDENKQDDLTAMGHAELDLHRDMREYQRRIAWDMPFLRSMHQPLRSYCPTTALTH